MHRVSLKPQQVKILTPLLLRTPSPPFWVTTATNPQKIKMWISIVNFFFYGLVKMNAIILYADLRCTKDIKPLYRGIVFYLHPHLHVQIQRDTQVSKHMPSNPYDHLPISSISLSSGWEGWELPFMQMAADAALLQEPLEIRPSSTPPSQSSMSSPSMYRELEPLTKRSDTAGGKEFATFLISSLEKCTLSIWLPDCCWKCVEVAGEEVHGAWDFLPRRLGLLLPDPPLPIRLCCCCMKWWWSRCDVPEALLLMLWAGDMLGEERLLPLPLLWCERGDLDAEPRTSLSVPLTISTNWRHFSMNSRLGLRSRRPG